MFMGEKALSYHEKNRPKHSP